MATFTSTSGSYTTTLTVNQTSQDTASNTSVLTYSLTLTKNSGWGLYNGDPCPWSITINGSTVSGTFTYNFQNYSSLTLKGNTTISVAHNSDGTKTVACSASVNMDNEPYVYTMKPSGDLALTTIPRASDISLSVSSFSITSSSGNAFSWSITAKSSSFYNRLRYSIGNKSNITSNKGQGNSSGYFTNQELLSALPTSTSGSLTVYCDTYSDSGYSNLIGSKSVVITVSVNTANIKPSVSLGNIGINSSPISSYAVAGYSKVQSAWTTTNSSGASSVTTYFTTSHGSLATTSSTSTSGTTVSGIIPSSSANYTLTISAYAKDSRGATSSTVSKSITVYGYTPPTATLNAYRVASSSSTTEDGAGTYAYVTFSGAVSSSVNSQNTIQSTTCTYSGSISGTATNGGHYALSDTQTVTFTLTVRDKVTSSTASVTIATATYPLDLYDDGNGNVGVGLGAIAKANSIITPLQIMSPSEMARVVLCDVTDEEVKAQDSTLTTSSSDELWFKALLKAICVKYPAYTVTRFIGRVSPNSQRNYEVTIYDTSVLRSGLPQYSYGIYHSYGGGVYLFGTNDGSYYWNEGVFHANTSNTATSASTAGTAGTATNASFADYLNLVATNEIRFRNRLQNAGGIWFNYRWYEGSYATLNGYNFGNGAGGYTHLVASGYYDNSSNKAPLEKTLWTGTKMAGESAGISLNVSAYKRLRIFFNAYSNTGVFELDLEHATQVVDFSGWSYRAVGLTYAYATNPETHFCDVRVNDAKTNVYPQRMGYYRWNSSASSISSAMDTQLRNQNSNYYVYRIDGIL